MIDDIAKKVRPSTSVYRTAGVPSGLTTLIPSTELKAISTGVSGANFNNPLIY